ncbi:hypothetical protein Q8A67_001647 [Cirrhinus molitorella]|uniref:AIG1-type G domain-containing protein n=1 Tax=Cirrhinus molitorella TaxID=172907 RepID=A0AA88QCG3_9TELE|nr:hypothetical protein Q8A67_001647 [Cirrhinus molitorella]
MSNNNRGKGNLESEEQFANFKRSRHHATLTNAGSPALYRLNTEKKYIDGTDKKVRQLMYGRRDRNKQNKVILMVGETGVGKTTITNTMVNYLLGLKFEDEEWYEIMEEKEAHEDQTKSQTSQITVYEVFVEENPTSLTIIDTPGYGHTEGYEKDGEVAEYLTRLFSDEDGIHYIDAVCFVMKASQNRLSGKEHYIFHSVLSLFGRDIENNIVFLLTHSDGLPPTNAINAIKTTKIPCRRDEDNEPVHFLFNNRQKEKRDKRYKQALKTAWAVGDESMNEFFTLLDEKNRKSVQMTLDVLKERKRLEACVCNLKDRISEKETKMKELTEIQKAIEKHKNKIEKCENFVFTVNKVVKEKVLIENEWWWNRNATCCSVCKENCHVNCWWVKDLSWCEIMKKGYCTACTGKCHYSKHIKENKKYVVKTEEIEMSFDDLKKEYEHTSDLNVINFGKKIYENAEKKHGSNMKQSETKQAIEEKLNTDLEKIKQEKSILLHEAYMIIMNLCKIALKADSAFTLQHLDFLIPRLKEEGKDEWMKLEDLRKTGEYQINKGALRLMMDFTEKKINQFHQRKSKERLPKMLSVFSLLEKQLVALYLRDFTQIQQHVQRVNLFIKTFEEDFSRADRAVANALNAEVAGEFLMGLGLVLAPVHLGISALITGVGAVALSGAAIGENIWNKKIMSLQTKLIQDAEAELREFQYKLSPMMDKMNDISQHVCEILRDLSYPERDVMYLRKYFSSASELVRFMQIYDISALAAQIRTQTSCLIGVSLIRVLPVRMALHHMWIEMVQVQDAMEEITKTIDRIAIQPD